MQFLGGYLVHFGSSKVDNQRHVAYVILTVKTHYA